MIRPGRRRRWVLFVLTGLTVACSVFGGNAAAEASPAGTAGTAEASGAAGVDAPTAPPDGCQWEVFDTAAGNKYLKLKCGDKEYYDTELPADQRPPLPAGCRSEFSRGEDNIQAEVIICEDYVPVTDTSMEWVECRDEHDFWFDDHDRVQIPKSAPQWWKDEIRIETAADEGRGCQIAKHPPTTMCKDIPNIRDYHPPGMLPDECWGTYPSANYTLSWNDGGPFDFENKMQGWTGSFMYTIGKGAIVIVLFMVGWAFSFDITQYTTFATHLAGSYQTNIVGPFELKDIVWFVLIAWCGFAALRGKIGTAGGEIVITMVVVGIMTLLLANQSAYMNKVAALMDETSARLLVAGQGERCIPRAQAPPAQQNNAQGDCREGEVLVETNPRNSARLIDEIRPLQQHIHEAFVEQPYAYLNWGQVATNKCLDAQNHIVGIGFDADGWPSRHMERAGCHKLAVFNQDASGERMLGAFLTMLVGLVVAFFLGLMAITVVISKFLVALLFAIAPFAAVGAVLPGSGRRLAWSWFGTLIQLVVAVVLMSFLLSLLLLGVDEVLKSTANVNIIQRWFVVLLTVGSVYFGRKRLLASSKSLGESFADSMTRLSPGGRNWSGASKGIDLTGIDRGAKAGLWAGGFAVAAGGRMVGNRLRERRVARRGYRNLERMERTRERPRLEYRLDGYRFHPNAATPAPAGLPPGGGPAPGGGPVPGGGPNGGPRPQPTGGPRNGPRPQPTGRPNNSGPNGRPSHIPDSFTQTPDGNWTGPAADFPRAPAAAAAR
ncbi:MAG TPA: type IV secretion system protein, partial [Acidimicrobiales bacterium]|nr:type IV secretion system protein [Acidimicrobiales bacterium]